MTVQEIKQAVDNGLTVHWSTLLYTVIKDSKGQYLIKSGSHYIGLTWADGVTLNGKERKDIKPERISEIVETVATWRKFNALHKWFVKNCQNGEDDCREHHVEKSKLEALLKTLKKIGISVDKAKKYLPTADGFFFGGTQYDEYYFEDVKETIVLLEELLKEEDEGSADFYYDSSW